MAVDEVGQAKQGARAAWSAGDYASIAANDLWPLGGVIAQRAGIGAGDRVLDVACGTGNGAIQAAQTGATVVGLDLTPKLLEVGRGLAADAGVEVEFVEGDAEALPFEDESFDVVLSIFGSMFAPRHDVTAGQLARVLRPGGRLVLFNWSPEGTIGNFFRTLSGYMPPPPEFASPPILWGSDDHVRELFDGTGVELEFERDTIALAEQFDTVDERIDYYTTKFGPLVMLKQLTESNGRWPELRADLARIYENYEPAEYLVVLGRKT